MERNTTFTEGKILQPLILFAMPVLFALFLQAMYGAVDLLVVGKFASSADVSAVSTGSQIMMTLTNLISSFAMGTTVLLGQLIGCGKKEEGGKAVGTAMVMFAGIALVMTVLLVCFAPQISSIMHAPKEAFDKTAAYVRICGCGMIVIVAYNLIGCIFRGIGDSKMPLFTVAIACVCNIAGDLVLCAGFHMGTAGAALATGISQFVSFCILLAMCNLRRDCISIDIRKFRPTLKLYGQILYGGVASLGRQGIASVATIIMNIMAQPYGDAAIAAMSIVNRFMMFVGSAMIGFGQGFQPVCSYCFGAGMYRRVKEACVFCIKVSTAVLFVFAVIGLIFSGNIVAVFRKDDMDVIRIGTLALRLQLCTLLLMGITVMGNMTPQSMGYGTWATVVSTARQGWFLIPLLLFLTPAIGILGIQIAQPLADIGTTILAIWALRLIFKDLLLKEEMSE